MSDAHTVAVTFVQRFDSALRLNLHFQILALDGVYLRDPSSGELHFAALAAPTVVQVLDVAKRTEARVCQLLSENGRYSRRRASRARRQRCVDRRATGPRILLAPT